jgi:hypothetical protein
MHVSIHGKSTIVARNLSGDYLLSASPNSGCHSAHHAIIQKFIHRIISRLLYSLAFHKLYLVSRA